MPPALTPRRHFAARPQLRGNIPFIFKLKPPLKYSHICEVRSVHTGKWRSTSTLKMYIQIDPLSDACVLILRLPFVLKGCQQLEVPLITLIRALGLSDGPELRAATADLAGPDVDPTVERYLADALAMAPFASSTPGEAMAWIAENGSKEKTVEKRLKYAQHIVRNEVVPHLGTDMEPATVRRKVAYLIFMARRLLLVHGGHRSPDDRDDCKNKRMDTCGPLLGILFRQLFRNHLKQLRQSLVRAIDSNRHINIAEFLAPNRIALGLQFHFSTGTWSLQRNTNNGVVQCMSRTSLLGMLSQSRRFSIPLCRDGKQPRPRQLHPSSWGIFDPSETPEGQAVGLVLNLALLCMVTTGAEAPYTKDAILPCVPEGGGAWPVLINGEPVASCADPEALAAQLRELRRCGEFSKEVSISVDHGVLIYSDGGRCIRPVYVVANLGRIMEVRARPYGNLWAELEQAGCIEWLDKMEEQGLRIAVRVADIEPGVHRHLEIDPSAFLGPTTASIPFSERNQAPRNMYQTSMQKQALSQPCLNVEDRFDVHFFRLEYATLPLVHTKVSRDPMLGGLLPSGIETIVAICSYTGFNQEDSLIVNQAAIDRGWGTVTAILTFKSDVRRGGPVVHECFGQPPEGCVGMRGDADYRHLEEDGLPAVGTVVKPGDVVVGRFMPAIGEAPPRDRSVVLRKNEAGIVDAALRTVNRDGLPMAVVRIRQRRKPEIGDKFSSRHGQKG